MKKSLLALTAALSFGFAAAQDTAPAAPAAQVPALTDVPAGHWAKDAIDKLVSQGIILGYPDGTFRGTQNLTRYEAAVIIARLLNQMGTAQAPVLDAETMTSLQNAIQELAADLAALGVRVSDLEENAVTKDDFARLEQRVEELGSMTAAPATDGMQGEVVAPAPFDNSANEQTQADLQDQVSTVQDQVSTNADDIAANTSAITDLQGQISDFTTRADDLQANYDTLRADVDDNASSIAALNDLTVLLNQDILNLQDRASAIEAAQADFVQRADFDNLVGRVAVTETKITDFGNRIATLEKNAFTIKPTLSATYFVARADRDMDIDRLFPGTKFSTGDDGDSATSDTPVDYVDLAGDQTKVVNNANGLYGFSTSSIVLTGIDPTTKLAITKTVAAPNGALSGYTISDADKALGYSSVDYAPVASVNKEGRTSVNFGITFSSSGAFKSASSGNSGAFLTSAGGVAINNLDVTFGISADPSGTGTQSDANLAKYPSITDSNGYVYKPLFFYFKNGTATFTVGNSPVTVDFGRGLKSRFSDYIFDNDKSGRGDGYNVTVDGSNLPVLGAFKPVIKAVYGSSRLTYAADGSNVYAGADTSGRNGDYRYYRGVRAEITPIGTLKLGLNYAQEAIDTVGLKIGVAGVRNVVAYGADAHGGLFGFQIDSEYARSTVTGTTTGTSDTQRTASAFYAKASGAVGPVRVYDLNYRSIGAGYDKIASISEANPKDGDNGSTAPYNRGNRNATDNNGVAQDPNPGQVGAGVEVGGTLGPVALGGYYGTQTIEGGSLGQKDNNGIVDFGVAAKVNLLNLVTVRGGYYGLYAGTNSADVSNRAKGDGNRYTVRADVTPGLGLSIGGFYRNLTIDNAKAQDDVRGYGVNGADGTAGLFSNSRYGAYYTLADNVLTNQSGCGAQHPGTGRKDTDLVGGALTFSLGAFSDTKCYSEYGAEIMHDGALPGALVKNLTLRFGYAARYRNATSSYSGSALYADTLYNAKIGFLNANVKALYNSTGFDQGSEPTQANVRTIAAGARVTTDPLDTIFKPSAEGQVGYLSRTYTGTNSPSDYDVSSLSYRAGVKFNDFLLPTGKLAVYYAGLNARNRAYTPWTDSTDNTAGYYGDQNTGTTINQNGLYVEGNYYDLSFAYGLYNLSATDSTGTQVALPSGQAAKGSTFKITYKVGF